MIFFVIQFYLHKKTIYTSLAFKPNTFVLKFTIISLFSGLCINELIPTAKHCFCVFSVVSAEHPTISGFSFHAFVTLRIIFAASIPPHPGIKTSIKTLSSVKTCHRFLSLPHQVFQSFSRKTRSLLRQNRRSSIEIQLGSAALASPFCSVDYRLQ